MNKTKFTKKLGENLTKQRTDKEMRKLFIHIIIFFGLRKRKKRILYLDMDGVIADFNKAIRTLSPGLHLHVNNFHETKDEVDIICEANTDIFHNLHPIDGAIEAVKELDKIFELYFLSTPMWNVPMSFTGKRIWLGNHFGELAEKKLILTHRKDLNVGHFLVDDTLRNGVDGFKGEHIHFGTEKFPNWEITLKYLKSKHNG